MYDFEGLIEEVLKSRPELTRQELMSRIEEKRKTVGAGYLTQQGALFLVAGELGVALQQVTSSDVTLKDLYVGANDVTVVARVLGLHPVTTYNRKDGGQGKYRRVVLFDKDKSVKLTVWDAGVDELEKLQITVGTPVRIVSGYVKQGLDGKPNLNLGRRSRLEVIDDQRIAAKLAGLDDVAEKLAKLVDEKQILALDCAVSSEPRYSEFVRADGTPGSLFQFGVTAPGGKQEYRMVIWSPAVRPEIKVGQRVRVTGVRTRRTSRGELEIHGDAGSMVLTNQRVERTEMRVCALAPAASGPLVYALDREKKVKVVEVSPEFVDSVKPGDVVGVSPDQDRGTRLVCKSEGSVNVVEDASFPSAESLTTKLKDAKNEASLIMVEVIALSHGTVQEANIRDGSTAKKGELVVGDDTGEVNVVAWREHSGKLDGIQPGQRLRILAVTPKVTKMGGWVLEASGDTVVEKIMRP
jgi:ssDNA-binding replication factor A large subunit